MSERRVRYYRKDYGQTADDAYECRTTWTDEDDLLEYIAEDCAENFHSQHDGWESRWPIQFTIILESGKEMTFEVDRDSKPVFSAREVKEKTTP